MTKEEFDHIFISYHASLCGFANGLVHDVHIAEDLVSDVFMKVWERKHTMSLVIDYRPYLYQSVRNCCYTYLKQAKRFNFQEDVPFEIANEEDLEIVHIEITRQVMVALEQLPSQCSKVIKMAYLDNLSTSEIASQLGITESTVYNQKAKGKSLLRKLLSQRAFQSFFSLLP